MGLLRLGQNRIRYRAAGRSDRGIGGSGWTRQYRPVDSFRWPLQNSVIKPADLTSSSAERSAPEHFTEPEPISETKKYPRSVGSQFMQFCPVLEGTPPTPNHLCCCTEICAELLRTRTGSVRFGPSERPRQDVKGSCLVPSDDDITRCPGIGWFCKQGSVPTQKS